jgi:hypothetical protein
MVPSLEQIEKMDRQRLQAIKSLQITDKLCQVSKMQYIRAYAQNVDQAKEQ